MALEEAASEIEDSKVECSEETPGDETKQEESDLETLKEEQLETTESLNQVEVNVQQLLDCIVASEKKEESVETENSEVPQDNTKVIKENVGGEENTENIESAEKDAPVINSEEKSPGEDATMPLENIKIKEEPLDDISEQPDSEMFDFDNVEVKEEPMEPEPGMYARRRMLQIVFHFAHKDDFIYSNFFSDPEQIVTESGTVDTTYAAVKSSIDGNVELDSAPPAIPAAPSRIKINITKPLNINKEPEENKEKEKAAVETSAEENAERPLVAASLKLSLQGRKLSNLPPVEKGQELSGLCSIM